MKSVFNIVLFCIIAQAASAYVTPSTRSAILRPQSKLHESFGFGFAENTYENQPDLLKGEGEYKAWMNEMKEDNFLNEQYNALRRVRELSILQATVDSGLLTSLDEQGLDLKTLEALLPLTEKLGLLSLVGNNQQVLINGVAPLAVEGAPFLLPVLGKAVKIGPPAFFGAAAAVAGLEYLLVLTKAQIPFVGLSASFYIGLLLIPGAALLALVGVVFLLLNQELFSTD